MICPQCHAQATKVGAFWVCPQHGQLAVVKPPASMRIFLSYGHDNNEELVRRIKAKEKMGWQYNMRPEIWRRANQTKRDHDA